jgi:hypothetical protein
VNKFYFLVTVDILGSKLFYSKLTLNLIMLRAEDELKVN